MATLTGLPRDAALSLLQQADGQVKRAVFMHHRNVTADAADELLSHHAGNLRAAIAPS